MRNKFMRNECEKKREGRERERRRRERERGEKSARVQEKEYLHTWSDFFAHLKKSLVNTISS